MASLTELDGFTWMNLLIRNPRDRGAPEIVRQQLFDCFEATKDHADYSIASADHFFFGAPATFRHFPTP